MTRIKRYSCCFHLVSTEGGELLLGLTVHVGSRSGSHPLAEELVGLNPVEGLGLHGLVVALNSCREGVVLQHELAWNSLENAKTR